MKSKILFVILVIFVPGLNWIEAQEASTFVKENPNIKHTLDTMDFVPNEILIKFKDGVEITPEKLMTFSSPSKGVNSMLADNKIEIAEKLFPGTQKRKGIRTVRTPQGIDMVIPNLHNIYRIVLAGKKSMGYNAWELKELINEFKKLPEVEYAEPDYYYSIGDFKSTSPEMTMAEALRCYDGNFKGGSGLVPNDPLYSQQWGIPATNVDDVWLTHTGDTSSVIAIIDSGVDWLHPDLAGNIWTNRKEIPGNGKDDDGNGFIDDVRGWDFINNDNDPRDDNSHGTHCAGIAAAVGDNGLGIAGVNWKARIMPVKVFQSSGWATASTVSKGINYAASNGANVLSMSFGGYALSLTMEQSLANAYATAVLVAAAGNDGLCIGPGKCPDFRIGMPLYPGGFTFVLGITTGASFTNFDQDGPVFSAYSEQYNYELSAPGVGILSCVPGGNYRSYSGTSMSTPLVAGAVSLYKELKSSQSQELIWGYFINSSGENIDLFGALNIIPKPVLNITKYSLSDTLSGDDRDWKADAGETIQLEIFVKNSWGTADSVFVGIEFAEFEDQTTATILQSEKMIGSIGAYGTLSNYLDPLEIKISQNVAHGRDIKFNLTAWRGKLRQFLTTIPIIIRVEHGTELKGILDDTLRLTPDKFWLVSNSFKIGPNGVLIIKPGTTLKIERQIVVLGQIISVGIPDSIIKITGPIGFHGLNSGKWTFRYTNFNYFDVAANEPFTAGLGLFENCRFEDFNIGVFASYGGPPTTLKNCELLNIRFGIFNQMPMDCEKVNFYNIGGAISGSSWGNVLYCNFSKFPDNLNNWYGYNVNYAFSNILTTALNYYITPTGLYWDVPNVYWGTTDSLRISKKIWDFLDDPIRRLLRYKPFLDRPTSKAHGCIWKVVVNDFDAQDEFKKLDALGVGRHKFEVYFNRPMDVKFTPSVSMGVRPPYNQVAISETASWSADSLIYTVYKTLGLSQSDGIHRIQVVGGKDTEGFDLVPENERFNVNVQSQGSLSAGFMATPGMGKVMLEWDAPDEYVSDLLGYNMYRYKFINESVTTDTLLISKSMIIDAVYTDFDVTPGTKYFYTYKTVRTNFTESSFSKIVAATPYTAAKGDANGDLSVNVSDILSVVSYILMKNPQPFIFEAADYNSDGVVNVLDITGIVKKILNPGKSGTGSKSSESATLFLRGDTLFVDSPVALGGIQFIVRNTKTTDYKVLAALESFERATISTSDSLFFLAYSMSGKTFGPGIVPLLKFNNGFLDIDNIIISTPTGNSLNVTYKGGNVATMVKEIREVLTKSLKATPNPFSNETMISYRLPVKAERVIFSVFNTSGIKVDEIIMKDLLIGENNFIYRPDLSQGLYIIRMTPIINGKRIQESSLKLVVR